jgi:hypothetical protein
MVEDFYGLKLREERVYPIKESGLNPLVFDGKHSVYLKMMKHNLEPTGKREYKLRHVQLDESQYVTRTQISEEEYDRVIFPAYILNAEYLGYADQVSHLRGTIRPTITGDFNPAISPEAMPGLPPQFHFFLEGPGNPQINYVGRNSSDLYLPNYIYTDIMETREYFGEVHPGFTVNVLPQRIAVFTTVNPN